MNIKNDFLNKNVTEPFSYSVLVCTIDKRYDEYIWQKEEDKFDFISPSRESVIEVTNATTKNEINNYEYDKAVEKKGKANDEKIIYYGNTNRRYMGSIQEALEAVTKSIEEKSRKCLRRIKLNEGKDYKKIELVVLTRNGGLLDEMSFTEIAKKDTPFTTIYILSDSGYIYIINKGNISKKKYKYDSNYIKLIDQ